MATLDVITLAEARSALNDSTSQLDATELGAYVSAISLRLDKLVGPIVIRSISNEVHDGGNYIVDLKYWPVSAVTSVAEHQGTVNQTVVAENFAAPTSNDYIIDLGSGVLRKRIGGQDARWWYGRANVVVSYNAGRFADTTSVDPLFKRAASIMLTHLWRGEEGASSSTFGGQDQSSNLLIPTFAVPNAVLELLADELHGPAQPVAMGSFAW